MKFSKVSRFFASHKQNHHSHPDKDLDSNYSALKALIKDTNTPPDTDQWLKLFDALLAGNYPLKKQLSLHYKASKRLEDEMINDLPCDKTVSFDDAFQLSQAYLVHRIAIQSEINHHNFDETDELIQRYIRKETQRGLKIADLLLEKSPLDEGEELPEFKLSDTQYTYLQNWYKRLWEEDLGICAPCCI